jgi:predicted  nucleic acid-binding Zn-ribbon protein
MVTSVSIKEQIKKLVELQKSDVDIYAFKRDLEDKPARIDELKEKFEQKKAHLKELENKLKGVQVDQKNFELDLKQKEDLIIKADQSLGLLKTNKEYQARLYEIENFKADQSIIEEKLLLLFDDVEDVRKKVDQEKILVAQEEKKYLDEKKSVDDEMAVLKDRISVLESQRLRLIPGVHPDYLRRYERILQNKEGIAIVPIKNHACGGCFMNVTQQLVNEIRMHEQIVSCDMCARMLYLEEDV